RGAGRVRPRRGSGGADPQPPGAAARRRPGAGARAARRRLARKGGAMTRPAEPPRSPEPFFHPYAVVCLVALGVIFVVEFPGGPILTTPRVLVVGVVGVLLRWRAAPLVLLLIFAAGHLLEQERLTGLWVVARRARGLRVGDVALCAAMLAYAAAHYR